MKTLILTTLMAMSSLPAWADFYQCHSPDITPAIWVTINGERTVGSNTESFQARAVRPSIGREALVAAWGTGEANVDKIELTLVRTQTEVGYIKAVTTGVPHYLTGEVQLNWLADGQPFRVNCTHFM